jgi:hypothetical protein
VEVIHDEYMTPIDFEVDETKAKVTGVLKEKSLSTQKVSMPIHALQCVFTHKILDARIKIVSRGYMHAK